MILSVNNIFVLPVLCLCLLLSGCSVFEMINNANPLPKDYKSSSTQVQKDYFGDKKKSSYQQELYNLNGNKTTYKEWHDNQYK